MTAASKPAIRLLFAEFAVRMVGIAFDMMLVIYVAIRIDEFLPAAIGTIPAVREVIFSIFAFLYFFLFWISPIRATPAQFLMGMRVVDKVGETLGIRQAAIRTISLFVLLIATWSMFRIPSDPYFAIVTLLSLGLLFLAALTPNRQAIHDSLAQSIVVNRTTLNSAQRREQLLEHIADSDPATYKQRRPTIIKIILDAFLLAAPLGVLAIAIPIQNDKDVLYRTSYAVEQIGELKIATEIFYEQHNRWPTHSSEMGVATRREYPDGGYYELEEDGVIRIRFTVKPELRTGSIIVAPTFANDQFDWKCRTDGDIAQNHLPVICRN